MNDVVSIIGFCILAAGIVISRIMSERAFRKLDAGMKVRIMDEFSSMRIWTIVPAFAMLILMIAGNAVYAGHEALVFALFLAGLVIYFAVMHRMIRTKMRKVEAPDDYIRSFMLSRWLSYVTLIIMLGVILGAGVWKAIEAAR